MHLHILVHYGITVYIGLALLSDCKISVVDRPSVALDAGIGILNFELIENTLVEDYKVSISDTVHRDVAGGDERLVCDLQGFLSTRCPIALSKIDVRYLLEVVVVSRPVALVV